MTLLSLSSPAAPAPALRRYRDLPGLGGTGFLPVALLARLPAAMTPLALLAFVAQITGSFAVAGLSVTGSALGTACGAPLMGTLADRLGQRPVLLVAAVLNAITLTALALAPVGTPIPAVLLLGVLVGLSAPQIGGMARVRWLALGRRMPAGRAADLTRLSMSWEGLADEVAYIAGPALAGLLAALAGPASALFVAGAVSVTSGTAFAVHRTHRLVSVTSRTAVSLPRAGVGSLLRLLAVPLIAMTMVGVLFAATQTGLTVYAADAGRPAAGGLLYAAMAITSAVSAALMSRLPARFGPRSRSTVSAAGLLTGVLMMSLTAHSGSLLLITVAVLFTGIWVSPVLITLNAVVGQVAPAPRMATAMALLASSVVSGVAIGATTAGALSDRLGEQGAFGTAAAALTVLVLTARALPKQAMPKQALPKQARPKGTQVRPAPESPRPVR